MELSKARIVNKNLLFKSPIALVIVLGFQLIVYLAFFYTSVVNWGATDQESTMQMPGDKYAESISSTRAITIGRPTQVVWQYLVNLGADRSGFYSYDFIEQMVGCEFANDTKEGNAELEVGRIISGDTSGTSQYGFKVIEAIQGQSAYLENWGGFLVRPIDANNTRLIIRTHEKMPNNLFERIYARIFDAMHHIMERRMMLGIKDLAENNNVFTSSKDLIWLLCVFLTGIAGIVLTFLAKGYLKYIFPTIIYTVWQLVLLIMNPQPIYGILIVFFTIGIFMTNYYLRHQKAQDKIDKYFQSN